MGQTYFNVEINNDYFRERTLHERNMTKTVAEGESREGTVLSRSYRLPSQEGEGYVSVSVREEAVTGCISRVSTAVTAHGKAPILVNGLSSLYYHGIEVDGAWWKEKDRLSVWICHNSWCGEGQWKEYALSDFGVYPGTFGNLRLISQGTWTTASWAPFVILCDKKKNVSYCIEPEMAAGRMVEIGSRNPKGDLYIYVSSANEKHLGWHRFLEDGQTVTSESTAFGIVEGGFEEAVAAMTEYRRKTSLVSWERGVAPLCFNDYMNCLWANPTREKLLPLIEAAGEAGAEIFCIDAGWFGDWHDPQKGMCGNWVPVDEPFGEAGLQGVLDTIREKGMIPGLWLELECVLPGAEFFRNHPEYLLTRHGMPIRRFFPDLRLQPVREYLAGQIDALCAMGVGYFKNDYNANLGPGCDSRKGGTLQDGALEYGEAFLSFIDETLARHPGLIIENCGSGAMRSDPLNLSHFPLQSITDHMDYENMPSIIQGSLAQMPPEKAGIWAYPFPLRSPGLLKDGKTLEEVVPKEDARTVFNLAGGLFGCFYLSGHIELADEKGKARLKEAADFYKSIRTWTCKSSAVYPGGMLSIWDSGVAVLGLHCPEEKRLLIGVFGSKIPAGETTLDLSKYCPASAKILRTFTDDETSFAADLPALTVSLPKGCHAAVFEIGW